MVDLKDEEKSLEILRLFKEMGVNMKYKDKLNQTQMQQAAKEGRHIEFLIDECGLDPNEKDIQQQVPLQQAAREGRINAVMALVDRGADICAEDQIRQTPVFQAAREGHMQIVKQLVDKCNETLDKNLAMIKDKDGFQPVKQAIDKNKKDVIEQLKSNMTEEARTELAGVTTTQVKETSPMKDTEAVAPPIQRKKSQVKEKAPKEKVATQKRYRLVALDPNNICNKIELTPDQINEFTTKQPDIAQLWSMDGQDDWLKSQNIEIDEHNKTVFKEAFLGDKARAFAEKPLEDIEQNWPKWAMKLVEGVQQNEKASIFREPVDPNKHGCLDYLDVIKKPMDLSTIMKKLNQSKQSDKCQPADMNAFMDDLRQIFINCQTYNGDQHHFTIATKSLETSVEKRLKEFGFPTLF